MRLSELREWLQGHGVALEVEAGQLKVTAPRGVLTPAIVAEIKAHRPHLLELLTLEARCQEVERFVAETLPAAETNERCGAVKYSDRQWQEIGDRIEEGLAAWNRLQELLGMEIPTAELAEVA